MHATKTAEENKVCSSQDVRTPELVPAGARV